MSKIDVGQTMGRSIPGVFYAGLCAGVGGIRSPAPIRSEKIGVNLASDSQNRGAIVFPCGHWRFFACSRNGRMNFFGLFGLGCVHLNTFVEIVVWRVDGVDRIYGQSAVCVELPNPASILRWNVRRGVESGRFCVALAYF
jgi:hypothetical protein